MDEIIKPQNLALSPEQLSLLLPYLIVSGGAMLSLLLGVARTKLRNTVSMIVGLVTLALAVVSIQNIWGEPAMSLFSGMLGCDYYSNLFNLVFVIATALIMMSSHSYLEKEKLHYPEYYSLMLFSCLGMMFLANSLDLVVLFVALEAMSLGVYVLVGFRRTDVKSNEAAVKYFVLGSAASAIMLFGVALTYGATGTMNLAELATLLKTASLTNAMLVLGVMLLIAGFLFKVATVPFHMWMPDVYEGAPTTVTSFMTTGLKAAAFASFLRVFIAVGVFEGMHDVLWVIAVATMFIGNVIALTQNNIKRMLAYSSIAHTGYILVGFISGAHAEYGYSSIVVYLIGYVVMNLGAFAVVAHLSESGDRATDVQDFAGLGFKHPFLGFAMAVFMFSMAGVPPTVGFAAKYLIFSSAIQAGEVKLTILAVLCSAISAYYYLRVIVYMYMKDAKSERRLDTAIPARLVILVATGATLFYGLFPTALIHAAKKAAGI